MVELLGKRPGMLKRLERHLEEAQERTKCRGRGLRGVGQRSMLDLQSLLAQALLPGPPE
jgi:hypothetical protein